MEFSLNEDQAAIRELAAQIFADAASDEAMLAFTRSGETYSNSLWTTLAEQGLLGINLPEALGGSGLGLQELCGLLEEQGRRVAPVPIFASLVLGALPILQYGTAVQQSRWLVPMVNGKVKLSAAIAELGMNAALRNPVIAKLTGANWRLTGSCSVVPDGAVADCVLVPALGEDGNTSIFLVDTTVATVRVEPQTIGLLGERAANIYFENTEVSTEDLLGEEGAGDAILYWLEERANIGHSALQLGVTEAAMKRTAAYVTEREQFGVPLGSFQALAMRMADSYIDVEAMRSTHWLALWRLSEGLEAAAEVRVAKWWACEGAHRVVQTAQHLHGGIGADVDYPIHRFFLWAKQISYSLGNATQQLEKLGAMLAADDSQGFKALEV
ncbi:MAG: alkylation response protein AidB-like acyl-CoA dehydrogenase [Halieaceae bacterium]|jgi:alkylation response protein AidB-like acyl-CoA dehydrogenase